MSKTFTDPYGYGFTISKSENSKFVIFKREKICIDSDIFLNKSKTKALIKELQSIEKKLK